MDHAEFTSIETEALRANELHCSGDTQGAIAVLDSILQRAPAHPAIVAQVAAAMLSAGLPGISVALFTMALSRLGEFPEIWANFAAALREAHLYEDAIEVGTKAAAMHKEENGSLQSCVSNLAGAWINQGNPGPGILAGRRAKAIALRLGIDNPATESNLGILCLEDGRWAEGWLNFRRRLEIKKYGFIPRTYPGVKWDGRSYVHHLLIHGEQGVGDEIMFLSLLEDVRPFAGKITLEVTPKLVDLARRSFPDCTVIGHPDELEPPKLDPIGDFSDLGTTVYAPFAWIAMGDIPAHFHGGVPPKRSGFIKPDPYKIDEWVRRFYPNNEHVTLLAFHGGTRITHEALRNPPLAAWKPVIEAARAKGEIYSIQYGDEGIEEAKILGIEHLHKAAQDIYEQAAAIRAADCLVSVQQTALHLAGGIGTRCLGVIPSRPAWRYGVRGPMPWYQTVELFRAKRMPGKEHNRGDGWEAVMKKVAEAL